MGDPRVRRAATFRAGGARFRNHRRSRDIPPRGSIPTRSTGKSGAPPYRRRLAADLRLDRRKPLHVARLQAADCAEERRLDLLGERTHLADSDPTIVDLAHWRDLRRGAAHERLVGAVEVVAREAALLDRDPLVLRDAQDAFARDPLEDAAGDRGRVEDAVAHQEDVLAGRLGDVALL